MSNKILAIFLGITVYAYSIISSAEDLQGNFAAPISLFFISAVIMMIFVIMATLRLWKNHKIIAILLLASSVVLNIYISDAFRGFNTIIMIWAIILLWRTNSSQIDKVLENKS